MENENQNMEQEPQRFDAPPKAEEQETGNVQGEYVSAEPVQEQSQGEYQNSYTNPSPVQYQPQYDVKEKAPKKHLGLAITSLVLSGISILCCWEYGIGIIPSLLGVIFGLIALIKGNDKSVRIMAGIGLGIGVVGMLLSIYMIISYAVIINWNNMTMENFQSIQNIDPNNQNEVMQWMQQFFNIDVTSYMN